MNKINYIKYFNIGPKTVKLLEDNIGENFVILGLARISWICHQKHKQQNYKSRQMGLHQTKKFLCSKGINSQHKKPIYGMEEIFAKNRSDKELLPKIYKELQNSIA